MYEKHCLDIPWTSVEVDGGLYRYNYQANFVTIFHELSGHFINTTPYQSSWDKSVPPSTKDQRKIVKTKVFFSDQRVAIIPNQQSEKNHQPKDSAIIRICQCELVLHQLRSQFGLFLINFSYFSCPNLCSDEQIIDNFFHCVSDLCPANKNWYDHLFFKSIVNVNSRVGIYRLEK